mgnify:CR=1 FL=1
MTEKHYGGATKFDHSGKNSPPTKEKVKVSKDKKQSEAKEGSEMESKDIEKLQKAGKIAKQTVEYAKEMIRKGMLLLEIADKIESKINELEAKPAFPINLSINEIAAHSTPSWNDADTAKGLLKVDIGVHIDGHIADTAFSVDLENDPENKKLIEAAELALSEAIKKVKYGITLREIGKIIENTMKSQNVEPIRNLSGHSIELYDLHAGITIPNYDNNQDIPLDSGLYAIEPFSTNGFGAVRDGKLSGIYHLIKEGNVRDNFAREVLNFITENYKTLPFCSRWIYKKFGTRGLLALKRIEEAGLLHHYSQLIEKGNGKVAQAEHTVILTQKEVIITTK